MTSPTDGLRLDLDALAELARKATPGPWRITLARDASGDVGIKAPGLLNVMAEVFSARDRHDEHSEQTLPTAQYIAALDPQTVLTLIDMARRAALPSEQTEPVAWLVRWRPEPNGPEWINAHASEPTAVDEARRHRGTVTPLYALEPLQKLQQLPALDPGEPKMTDRPRMRLHHEPETTAKALFERARRLDQVAGFGYEMADFLTDIMPFLAALPPQFPLGATGEPVAWRWRPAGVTWDLWSVGTTPPRESSGWTVEPLYTAPIDRPAESDLPSNAVTCPDCHGAGRHANESQCSTCAGEGWVLDRPGADRAGIIEECARAVLSHIAGLSGQDALLRTIARDIRALKESR